MLFAPDITGGGLLSRDTTEKKRRKTTLGVPSQDTPSGRQIYHMSAARPDWTSFFERPCMVAKRSNNVGAPSNYHLGVVSARGRHREALEGDRATLVGGGCEDEPAAWIGRRRGGWIWARSRFWVPPAPSARSFFGYHVNPQLEKVFAMDSHIFNKYPQTKSIFGVRGVFCLNSMVSSPNRLWAGFRQAVGLTYLGYMFEPALFWGARGGVQGNQRNLIILGVPCFKTHPPWMGKQKRPI